MDKEENIVVCRCEDVTLAQIRECLRDPHVGTFEDVKRILRVTMGPCGGRSCRDIVLREIARARGESVADVAPTVFRPPATPIPLETVRRGIRETASPTDREGDDYE
ncbi:MAG: (2Fe-2S)-binding protein [Clostridia bacterium]